MEEKLLLVSIKELFKNQFETILIANLFYCGPVID